MVTQSAPQPSQAPQSTPPKRATCPTCGARLARPELSLCSYCAAPLSVGGGAQPADAATLQRLARMKDHKDYPEAMSWEPTSRDDAPGAVRARPRAWAAVGGGTALAAWGVLIWLGSAAGGLTALRAVPLAVGGLLVIFGLLSLGRTSALVARVRRTPLQRRPAIVIDRRSVTEPQGWGAQTVYIYSLQFEDGQAGQFSFHGRGSNYEVPMSGATGLAATRGNRLLEFLRIRV